jgi:hypothetical protein
MNMTPKSMSSNESSGDGENIVLRINSNSRVETGKESQFNPNNTIKIKLDDMPEISKLIILPLRLEAKYHTKKEIRL